MIAVCGIGKPRGCRNSAVTANQSAIAPIIAASEARETKPQTPVLSVKMWVDRKMSVARRSSESASVRIFFSPRARSWSSGVSSAGPPVLPPAPKRGTDGAFSIVIVTPWSPTLAKPRASARILGPIRCWEMLGIRVRLRADSSDLSRASITITVMPPVSRTMRRSQHNAPLHQVVMRLPVGDESLGPRQLVNVNLRNDER
jgi:hypothetical protein